MIKLPARVELLAYYIPTAFSNPPMTLNSEVRNWCRDFLSEVPSVYADDYVYIQFKSITDAIYFKLKWYV